MRDKVKRFLSILMTALMLVNLMPVGALADGITSIGYKPEVAASTGNYTVYVYARFDGDPLPGVTLNGSQWYTIGYIKDVNLPSPGGISWWQYWYYNNNNYCGSTINSTSASGIIGGLVQEYNTSIVIKSDEWISANFKACPGADTYKPHTSEPTWHLDIIVDINKNPPVHNLVFKVNNSNGKQIGTPKKVTGRWTNPLSSNKYYAGNPVPETIIDGGRIYQLKTKREGNPNLDTKIYFDEPIKNVEFYYKDMGPVKRNYTVNYYLNGTEEKVKTSTTGTKELGETVTPDTNVSGYTLVPGQETSLTIVDGNNVLNLYYYKNVELTANSDTVTYNGQEQSVSGFSGAPEDADFSAIKVGAKGTNAGTYDAIFPTGTKGTVDATKKYIVTKATDGQLVISKRPVTLTSASDEKVYDGTALTNDTVTVGGADGFADGEGAEYNVTGTQTNVGSSDNTFTYTLNKGTKADNYDIKTENGTLTVTPVTDKVTVTITGNTASEKYDGTEKTASGYGVSISNEKYTEADFEFKGTAEVKGTDANTYPMGLTAANFTNKSANFTNVEFVVNDGKLEIEKRVVTLTSDGGSKVYDGTPLTKPDVTIGGDGFADGEGAAYDVTGSQTVVGESDNTFTYTLNKGTKADNYTIEKAEGKLKVTAATDEVVVTIKENAGTAKYDGTEKTVTGYTVTNISNKLYAEKDFTFNGKAEVKGTDAGTYDMALKASDFTNRNANFSKVTFVIEDGQLVIEKRKVTLTSASDEKVYDGTALTNGEVTVSGDGFADGEGAAYDVTGSRTDVGESDNTFTYTLNKGTKADNYTIEKTEGKLKVTPVTDEVVVTIEGRTKTVTYNGEEHTAWQYDVVRISDPLYEPAPGEAPNFWNKNAKGARGTDAGTYPMGWVAEDFENTNTNFSNVKFVVTDGKLVINPRPVTLTSADLTKVYDGTPLKNGDAPVTEMSGTEKAFPDGEGLDYTFTGGQTDVGKSANTFTYKPKEGTNPDNYAITTEYGTLEVTPVTDRVTVKIKGKTDSVMYDGKLHFVFGFDAEPSNKLYNPNEDIQFNGTDVDMIAEGTDAGEYEMGLTVERFTNKSKNFTNVRFEVVEDGKLEIKKRSVKLTSASDEKVYDGKPLMNETVAVGGDGFADGEGVTYDFTGSQTDVGESENLFTFEVNEGTKKENYTFEVAIGTLKVNPVTDKVTVTVTEKSDTVTYDGMPHTVSGYASMTADNPLYDVKNDVQETPNAAWAANGTDAGEYPLGIVAGDFKNTNKNFTDVEFVVVDGALTITPAPVTLQAPIASKPYDGTPLKAEDYGHSFVEGLDFADDFASISVEGSQTQAGSSVSQIKEVVPKKGKDLKNYKLTFLPGTLTIAKRSVLITSQSATKTYDGSALTRPAVTITGDGFVPGELAKAEATGSITKVGSTPNTIQYTTTGAFNAANYSIALSVGTLTVTEKPKPEPRRTFNLTINYVYQNGKRAAASYNRGGLKNGETFDITSPVIAGYTASETVVSGTVYNRDIKVTVIYTADGVNLDDYGVPLGLGNITMNVGDCFE